MALGVLHQNVPRKKGCKYPGTTRSDIVIKFTKSETGLREQSQVMETSLPLLLFIAMAVTIPVVLLSVASVIGPRRPGRVKEMPYESGMDPIHDTRRRFDVRFHLVAVAFLLFDVELLFFYPWAVASRNPVGIEGAIRQGWVSDRGMVFGGVLFFLGILVAGLVYEWRKGVLQWR
jgi:NADH-quinone oxidoreductase subunit A